MGLFEPLSSFVYSLVIGGVDRKAYFQMMEKEALLSGPNETASELSYKTTGQYTDVRRLKGYDQSGKVRVYI